MSSRSAIVVGAGIVGLATARALAKNGFKVSVFERTERAVGASIRNFGLILPFAQPDGPMYERAIRTRSVWKEISETGAFPHLPVGSMFVAYQPLEWTILQELYEIYGQSRNLKLLNPQEVCQYSQAIIPERLLGGLYSPDEMIVDPREAIASLPKFLESVHKIRFYWGRPVQSVSTHKLVSNGEEFQADLIFVCSGADFESLYPGIYGNSSIIKCKLQMMRTAIQPDNWRIGPALCGGLSLIHYKSFTSAPSIGLLKDFYEQTMKPYMDWGIHVMVTQNPAGELTIGDSHEYGNTFDPFQKSSINNLVLDYLNRFAVFRQPGITQTWSGIYSKMTDGSTEICLSPEPGVYILNALGGAGMSLSFGLAEEVLLSL